MDNIAVCYFIAYYIASEIIQFFLEGYSIIVIDNISMFVGMVLFVFLNFFGQRYIVFKKDI